MTLTVRLMIAVLVAMAGAVASSDNFAAATEQVIDLRPIDAAWTSTADPGAVHTQTPYLSVTHSQDRTYLKFDGSQLAGAQIASVTLHLGVVSTSATAGGIVAYPASTGWTGHTLTDQNRPPDELNPLSTDAPRARTGESISMPLDPANLIWTQSTFAIRLAYSQAQVGTSLLRDGDGRPVLQVTLADSNTAEAQSAPSPPAASSTHKMVFAHYFTPYPLSLDNRPADSDYYANGYLSPNGEGGTHAAYGGLLRDRPLPVAPDPSPDWRVRNLETEIWQAKAAGIDGFTVNLMGASGANWRADHDLMQAAQNVGGFVIVPMVDASSSFWRQLAPAQAAADLAQLYAYPSAYRTDQGYVLSSFYAEGLPVSWWSGVINRLEREHKIPIRFQAVFLNASASNMRAFASIADGFGNWGTRTVLSVKSAPDYAGRAHALGKTWMAPVAVQDVRPRAYTYAESDNTATLRAMWARAIDDGADSVQMVTWNDYSESTQFAPSVAHKYCFLDMSTYYIHWFHADKKPSLTQDQVSVTHRTQFANATPTFAQQLMRPDLGGGATTPRNDVEVLTYLTAPATVKVTVGDDVTTYDAPAGVSAHDVPVHVGSVSVTVTRSSKMVLSVASSHQVVNKPHVQDLQYFAACQTR